MFSELKTISLQNSTSIGLRLHDNNVLKNGKDFLLRFSHADDNFVKTNHIHMVLTYGINTVFPARPVGGNVTL